jgi:DNA polymerase-4
MQRKILHLDLDAFFCSVEELLDPDLKGKAFAVGGRPDKRGVVASCSYAARFYGVRSAMPTVRALQLHPQLIIISGRHGVYGEYSERVMKILQETSPLVQQVSIDEAFIDVSDMPQSGEMTARILQSRIDHEVGLPCSIGVAANKLVAKIANDFGKSIKRSLEAPRAITTISPGDEAKFLAPLKVQMLWGIGPKSAERLNGLGIRTIGELALMPAADLTSLFGRFGPELLDRARGIDESPITLEQEAKSISNEVTFENDLYDKKQLLDVLRSLSEKVGSRLRKAGLAGHTVHIKLRYADFSTITRQIRLQQLTDQDKEIYATAVGLFIRHWKGDQAIRLLGIGISGLSEPIRQLDLWDQTDLRERKLLQAVDELKERYGNQIIQRASRINKQK